MEILVPGLPETKTFYKSRCYRCRCVYRFNRTELDYGGGKHTSCPECGAWISSMDEDYPDQFDSVAATLAVAVISGDKTAARALVDRCIELIESKSM